QLLFQAHTELQPRRDVDLWRQAHDARRFGSQPLAELHGGEIARVRDYVASQVLSVVPQEILDGSGSRAVVEQARAPADDSVLVVRSKGERCTGSQIVVVVEVVLPIVTEAQAD